MPPVPSPSPSQGQAPSNQPWWLTIHHPAGLGLPRNVVERGRWYRSQKTRARWLSQTLDVVILLLTAGVPFSVAVDAPAWVGALLGALAAVCTGVRQTFGWHQNWTSFARVNGQIEAEIVRFGYAVEPYHDPRTAEERLATRVENIASEETGAWMQRVNETVQPITSTAS